MGFLGDFIGTLGGGDSGSNFTRDAWRHPLRYWKDPLAILEPENLAGFASALSGPGIDASANLIGGLGDINLQGPQQDVVQEEDPEHKRLREQQEQRQQLEALVRQVTSAL